MYSSSWTSKRNAMWVVNYLQRTETELIVPLLGPLWLSTHPLGHIFNDTRGPILVGHGRRFSHLGL